MAELLIASEPITRSSQSDHGSPVRGPIARALPWILLIGGILGLLAAGVLLIERIALLEDPSYVPSCSINPILSCGSVMRTPQAEAFGFPNPIIGVAGFAIVTTVGAVVLAGAVLKRWFWIGLQIGVTFGIGFVHWLVFQTLYRIDALCPYCMVVWAVTLPIFWYTTLWNLDRSGATTRKWARAAIEFHGVGLTLWYLAIIGLVAQRFWDYWVTLLP